MIGCEKSHCPFGLIKHRFHAATCEGAPVYEKSTELGRLRVSVMTCGHAERHPAEGPDECVGSITNLFTRSTVQLPKTRFECFAPIHEKNPHELQQYRRTANGKRRSSWRLLDDSVEEFGRVYFARDHTGTAPPKNREERLPRRRRLALQTILALEGGECLTIFAEALRSRIRHAGFDELIRGRVISVLRALVRSVYIPGYGRAMLTLGDRPYRGHHQQGTGCGPPAPATLSTRRIRPGWPGDGAIR